MKQALVNCRLFDAASERHDAGLVIAGLVGLAAVSLVFVGRNLLGRLAAFLMIGVAFSDVLEVTRCVVIVTLLLLRLGSATWLDTTAVLLSVVLWLGAVTQMAMSGSRFRIRARASCPRSRAGSSPSATAPGMAMDWACTDLARFCRSGVAIWC